MQAKSFYFNWPTVLAKLILYLISPADRALQARECNLAEALRLYHRSELQKLRSDDGCKCCNDDAEAMIVGITPQEVVDTPANPTKRKRTCTQSVLLNDSSVTAPTGSRYDSDSDIGFKSAHFEAIDTDTLKLDRRFLNQPLRSSNGIRFKLQKLFTPKKIDYLQKLNITRIPSGESTVLRELAATTNSNASTAPSVLILYRFKQAFPDTYCMAASVATLGCSTALCESTFSKLARIDVPERRSMTTHRKSNLSLLAFEHKRTESLDMQLLLRKFAAAQRRLQLF